MYIIEKIIQLVNKIKNKDEDYIPNLSAEAEEQDEALTCKHTFMPIDSTGEILACSKCGFMIRKDKLKN